MLSTQSSKVACWAWCGIGRYPGSRLNSVGMSVEPWMLACPRRAMMPPPGRPMLPSSSWMIAPVRVLGVPEVPAHERGGVGVRQHVLAKVQLVAQDVVDHPAEERDVGTRPDRHVSMRDGAGTGEARIDVDHLRAAQLRLHHPL